ncbi:MAG: DUF3108 domain-containing protein [Bacteroidales bacterium]|jgi:hypothetical protein|nr:DUF3108 domain-containing protein [Bacteroidales bacterium]
MIRSLFISITFSLFAILSFAQNTTCPPARVGTTSDLPYQDGEVLKYSLSYNWGGVVSEIAEGVASLKYYNTTGTGEFFHAVVEGKTYKFYDLFFKVRDYYESRFYTGTLRPFHFHRNVQEGKYRMRNNITFFPDDQIRAITRKYDNPQKDTLLKGSPCTYDIVTMFYYARTIDIKRDSPGKLYPVSFVIDDDIYDISFRYLGREVKKISGMGTFRTTKFAVKLIAGTVFRGDKEMIIWISDDENKIPLGFEVEIIIGKLFGTLKSTEKLKYPMTSKIK